MRHDVQVVLGKVTCQLRHALLILGASTRSSVSRHGCLPLDARLARDRTLFPSPYSFGSVVAMNRNRLNNCIIRGMLRSVVSERRLFMADSPSRPERPRVSAAVLRDDGSEVLMVKHRRRDGTEYWQLPGGGMMPGETPEGAVLRELQEETTLSGRVVKPLFTIPYKFGTSTTFLVETEQHIDAILGFDPEESDAAHRKLVAVAWLPIAAMADNPEIKQLLLVL
jgi:8-oxo-dGTP diphosphatase